MKQKRMPSAGTRRNLPCTVPGGRVNGELHMRQPLAPPDESVCLPAYPVGASSHSVSESGCAVGSVLPAMCHLDGAHGLVERLDRRALAEIPNTLFEWSLAAPSRVRRCRSIGGRSGPTPGGLPRPWITLFPFVGDGVSGTASAAPSSPW
jgi:hypothetical protein